MPSEQSSKPTPVAAKNIMARKYEPVAWTIPPTRIGAPMPPTAAPRFRKPPSAPTLLRVASKGGMHQYRLPQRKKKTVHESSTTTSVALDKYATENTETVAITAAVPKIVRNTVFGLPPAASHISANHAPTSSPAKPEK